MNEIYIQKLKEEVENKYGKKLKTSTDFEKFSIFIGEIQKHTLSSSTLKRIWNYVNDKHQPSITSLDILSKFLGFKHFNHFCEFYADNNSTSSGFIVSSQIRSEDLCKGERIEIRWNLERIILLEYEDDCMYTVIEAENSMIQKGDKFKAISFIEGEPLYLPYIIRNKKHTAPFIAGKKDGLTSIHRLKHE
ncbi:MAG: hypothetical protein IJ665_08740 [Phocaeicola sp.]|nr:hypothetical protein [Phocaeicola sp.]